MSEIEAALRDLEDEYADGFIDSKVYQIRKQELMELM